MGKQADHDNHANQMNPNNDAYWQARGLDARPEDWEELSRKEDSLPGQKSVGKPGDRE